MMRTAFNFCSTSQNSDNSFYPRRPRDPANRRVFLCYDVFMRVLGIDYGEKRIGLAVADTDHPVALPRSTVENGKGTIRDIAAFCRQEQVGQIVMGLPLTLRGEEGEAAKKTRAFGEALAKEAGIATEYLDERLTTAALPKEGVVSRDAAAAALILQTWLDRRSLGEGGLDRRGREKE